MKVEASVALSQIQPPSHAFEVGVVGDQNLTRCHTRNRDDFIRGSFRQNVAQTRDLVAIGSENLHNALGYVVIGEKGDLHGLMPRRRIGSPLGRPPPLDLDIRSRLQRRRSPRGGTP